MRRLALLGLLAVLLLPAAATGALAEKRVALVIGNAAYAHAGALANPANDAGDVTAALERLGFEVIAETDVGKAAMDEAFRRFARAMRDADAALFFYAGHGMQFRGVNYLMPVDAKLEDEADLPYEMAQLDSVLADMSRVKGVRIAILDACRDNPLERTLKRRLARTRNIAPTRGLARIKRTEGLLIAYATQPGNIAEDGKARNSPFTRALLAHIETPALEVGPLFRRVAASVNKATAGKQTPELSVSLLGEFYFKPGAPAPSGAAPAKPDRVAKLEQELAVLRKKLQSQKPAAAQPSPETVAPETEHLLALGRRHLAGEGVPNDPAQAANLFREAAEAGEGEAMVELAGLYERGEGVARNDEEAAHWYHRAAEKDVPQAMHGLGVLHLEGRGVPRNARGAADWFRAAAERGVPDAMHALGALHARGEGAEKNVEEARHWFEKAAEAGLPDAMVGLADIHHHGKGVPPDPKRAAHYIFEALKRVPKDAAREIGNDVAAWSPPFRRQLQALLREAGAYPGPIDGRVGPGTRRGIEAVARK